MALRAYNFVKSMAVHGGLGGGASHFTTSAPPKMKAFTPTPDKSRIMKGEMVPMGVAMGMITLSTSLGIYTAMKELRTGPYVYVRKSRRKTIPEVVEPEVVIKQSEKFINQSFFRRIAQIRHKYGHQPAPIDIFSRPPRPPETLKDIGVNPINQ